LTDRASGWRRWEYVAWLLLIAGFAILHALHVRADFPNGSPWIFDWAKYTDEGWYGNAAVRAHLFGNWYVPGDFNPAVAVPVWPFVEWVLFFFTGVRVEAARGLAIACFLGSLAFSYLLLCANHPRPLERRLPRWVGLAGLSLIVTSPFLYCFSRLAILEPLQTTLTLGTLNLAVRLPRMRRQVPASAAIGFLFALTMLTKTTELFLFPAVGWAIVVPLWEKRGLALKCAIVAASGAAATYAAWVALMGAMGLISDYRYYFFVNTYPKPSAWYWPLESLWWSLHGLLWVDHSLIPMAGAVAFSAVIARRGGWARRLWREPLFGCSLCVVAGYVLFMTLQDHPQPRYFALPAFFCFFVVSLGAWTLLNEGGWKHVFGWAIVLFAAGAACVHGTKTIAYAMHPEYTFVNAAAETANYIDAHPNGKRLLVSISGDEIALIAHLRSLCDDFGTEDLAPKTAVYQPGWYAAWNDLDPGTLQDLHAHFSLEQVATFPALDARDRNLLVLFKLHPLADGQTRELGNSEMRDVMPGDKIDVPVE